MDFLTQKFIAAGKWLHEELRALRQSIDALRDQNERQHQERQAQRRPEQPPNVGIRGEINAEIHETEAAQTENRTRHNRNFWVQVALAVGTWFAFGAAAYYAGIAKRQLGEIVKQYPELQKSAQAAADSVTVTRENARLDQRAWIGIGSVTGTPSLNEIWKVVVVYHNSGRTPARKIFGQAVAEPVAKGSNPNFSYVHDVPFQGGMIPPNGDYNTSMMLTKSKSTGKPAPVIQPMLDSLDKDDFRAYIHGQVDYDDIFGCRHWMTFCYFYNPPTNGFGACTPHNDTGDYECKP